MMTEEDCKKNKIAFTDGTETNENKLLQFLKENYPSVIHDSEINLTELKNALQIPVDEKTNGYGLNFVGRNFARAKYASKTKQELQLNTELSKNIDTTQNLVLKGDNLDSLKILKSHYSGSIKCIYIDPPYNTASEEFVYTDKFDEEEREVLGFANLSDDDIARMDFSFKTKKSHNGWLSFMYPRLLLARDLLRKDGIIFISIDDNEQANLKLLCDDVFGEENIVANIPWQSRASIQNDTDFSVNHEYVLAYAKLRRQKNRRLKESNLNEWQKKDDFVCRPILLKEHKYENPDNDPRGPWKADPFDAPNIRPNLTYKIENPLTGEQLLPPSGRHWRMSPEKFSNALAEKRIVWTNEGKGRPQLKVFYEEKKDFGSIDNSWFSAERVGTTTSGTKELMALFDHGNYFDKPKPTTLIYKLLTLAKLDPDDVILDFFAGSGTTGDAVMQLNAEDGGNRKFILCQIDEPIDNKKEAYKFCKENKLPLVISSITIERLKRAGKKIVSEINEYNKKVDLLEDQKKKVPDIGYKVFDSVKAPQLTVDVNGTILLPEILTDTISRVYNMVFTVGLDEPTQVPEMVKDDCMYKIGTNYYLTNCSKLHSSDYEKALKNGKVFIDGWTADLNGTLQNYKEDVKIVF